ncbi:MAG: hypothetical protein ACOC9I_00110 [Actinomycetota bacterium]
MNDYRASVRVRAKALRRYQPGPAHFPVTVIQPHRSRAASRWQPLAPDLTVHEVGGDHRSMVEHPHATDVAAHLDAVLMTAQ